MSFRYTQEMLDFLRKGYREMCLAALTSAFNQRFELDKPESSIRGVTRNHKMKSGRTGRFEKGRGSWNAGLKGWLAGGRSVQTQFKKGRPAHESANYVPIGSTRVTTDGYIERKVTDDRSLVPARRWVMEQRLVWEAEHGEIPGGHVIVFLDGDRQNLDLDNLRCVHRAVLQYINKMGLNETTGEARKAAILTAELVTAANRRKREHIHA